MFGFDSPASKDPFREDLRLVRGHRLVAVTPSDVGVVS